MATNFDNVIVVDLDENGQYDTSVEQKCKVEMSRQGDSVTLCIYNGPEKVKTVLVSSEAEYCRLGKQCLAVTTSDQESTLFKFESIHKVKSFQFKLKELKKGLSSVFTDRTDEASAVQYFQFYGYLSQQQNMMQDYIRTSTYQRAMLSNVNDFLDKVVLDVGAGSGILSFFAIQAGARKVYAVEASNMAEMCEQLVQHNRLQEKIVVIPGKIEEIALPEKVDTIISEPMGYMLFNERMLESFLHAKKWLKPKTGKMYPSQGDLHVAPFTDEALYMEQFSKANFWYQESFHGINLTCLRNAAVKEYFKQPIVDTFDIRMLLSKSIKHTVDFLIADETDLHVIEIPLNFTIHQSGLIHGLAFWFDVAFLGTVTPVWLSTSPTETLTHWYQVRCLVQTPVLVKQGQTLTGKCILRCNTRQSYDVDIELNIPGTTSVSSNSLDLKNPFFRYTGQQPAAQPGTQTQSPSDAYWNSLMTTQSYNTLNMLNGNGVNGGMGDAGALQMVGQTQGMLQSNFIQISGAPINPGSIPSVLNLTPNSSAGNRTSIGGGISPINFATTQPQNTVAGQGNTTGPGFAPNTSTGVSAPTLANATPVALANAPGAPAPAHAQPASASNYPISSQFMIGDYVVSGNLVPCSTQLKS